MNEKDIFLAIIAKHIRNKRLELCYTQEKVAYLVSIDYKHFGKIERGEKLPNSFTFAKIKLALDLDNEYLTEFQNTIQKKEE